MKKLLLHIFLVVSLSIFAQDKDSTQYQALEKIKLYNPFDSILFDSMVAYNFHVDRTTFQPLATHEQLILRNGYFDQSTIFPGKTLTKTQTERFIKVVIDTSTYGEHTAACFEPHLAFVLYKNGKPINSINVCFMCKFLEADFKIPAEEYYCIDYGIINGKRSIYCLEGFSDIGESSLISFCEELKMPFCVRK